MIFRVRWPFLIMAVILLLSAGAGAFAYFTDYFILRKVTFTPDKYSAALKEMDLLPNQNILLASTDDAVSYLLYSRPIAAVDLQYKLPNAFDIKITDFVPIGLMLGENKQTIFGVDDKGRLLPIEESSRAYDLPFITGLKTCPLYHRIPDYRLFMVMQQLSRLKMDAEDFYHSLSTIDFTSADSIIVRSDGLPYSLVMNAGGLYEGIMELKQFLLGFNPDLKETMSLDFRSEGQIIALKREMKNPVKARSVKSPALDRQPDGDKKKNVRSKNNNRH